MEKRVGLIEERVAVAFCCATAVLAMAVMLCSTGNGSIWYDEAFSLGLIRHSYGDLLRLAALDSHPPLYYLLLKPFADAAQSLGFSAVSAAKTASTVPYMLMMLLSATKIRRNWGNLTAATFSLCVVAMPQMPHYGVEIRMYSWGMLFVTCSYIWMYDVLKYGRLGDWCAFALYSLAAAYTHYYACVAVAFVYLYLFVYFVVHDRARLKRWLLFAFLTVVGYIPWLLTLLRQISRVSANYWIGPITARKIFSYGIFAFYPGGGWPGKLAFALMILVCLGAASWAVLQVARKRAECGTISYCGAGALVLAGTVLFGIAASLLLRPVFVSRYMVPALGSFWLSLAILLGRMSTGRIRFARYAALCVLLLVALINLRVFAVRERSTQQEYTRLSSAIETLEEDSLLVTSSGHFNYPIALLTGLECRLLRGKMPLHFEEVLPNTHMISDTETVREHLATGKPAYFFGYQDGNYAELFDDSSIDYIILGDYRLEQYNLSLCQLELI